MVRSTGYEQIIKSHKRITLIGDGYRVKQVLIDKSSSFFLSLILSNTMRSYIIIGGITETKLIYI